MHAVPLSVEQLVGQTVDGYTIDQLLGQGKLSAVYLAHQLAPRRRVLLTVFLLPDWCEGQPRALFMERFSRQGSLLVSLDHPHILPTYAYGEAFGYPYLVTAYIEEVPLARVLKQQMRCTTAQTLVLLKQLADGLDYAHSQGIVHGTLRPANIMLDGEQNLHITGLGLARILEMRDIGTIANQPLPYLYSIAGTLLYSTEYLAPEVVEGKPADARSDIYALGVVAYELLCGAPPFTGTDPLAVAMQHVQSPVPSLQTGYAQAPAALDLIIQRALDRNPEHRFQSASRLANAFERVIGVLDAAASSPSLQRDPSNLLDISQRPTLHWFEAETVQHDEQWDPQIPHTSSYIPVASSGIRPVMPPAVPWQSIRSTAESNTRLHNAPPNTAPTQPQPQAPTQLSPSQSRGDQPLVNASLPLDAWPTMSPEYGQSYSSANFRVPAEAAAEPTQQPAPASSPVPKKSRRSVLLLAGGGIVAAGALAYGGLNLAHLLNGKKSGPGMTNPQAAVKSKGAAINAKKLAVNAAKSFTNSADGKASLLIHLPSGDFVAYESACTHEGVIVHYDPASHQLICPKHGSIFDPAKNGAVVKGPAAQPLPKVQVHINADGTLSFG